MQDVLGRQSPETWGGDQSHGGLDRSKSSCWGVKGGTAKSRLQNQNRKRRLPGFPPFLLPR